MSTIQDYTTFPSKCYLLATDKVKQNPKAVEEVEPKL